MCKAPGCDRRVSDAPFTRNNRVGLCRRHYQRLRKTGDPVGSRRPSWDVRLTSRIDTAGGEVACHPWTGFRNRDGYGLISAQRRGKSLRVSRVLMEIELGRELLDAESVLHTCDDTSCCNLRHMKLGTQAESMADMVARGRRRRKFTNDDLLKILDRRHSRKELMAEFGISKNYIDQVRRNYRPGASRSHLNRSASA